MDNLVITEQNEDIIHLRDNSANCDTRHILSMAFYNTIDAVFFFCFFRYASVEYVKKMMHYSKRNEDKIQFEIQFILFCMKGLDETHETQWHMMLKLVKLQHFVPDLIHIHPKKGSQVFG